MIALDIGAGGTSFGKDLRKLNPQISTVICADPYIEKDFVGYQGLIRLPNVIAHNIGVVQSRFEKILTEEQIQEVIQNSKKGIFKTLGSFQNTQLPDESVDIITLNSPHPLMPPRTKDFDEFYRVLKKGGIFFFGHSIRIFYEFDENKMRLIEKGAFYHHGGQKAHLNEENLTFPMSRVIRSNVAVEYFQNRGIRLTDCNFIYPENGGISIYPNWKVWKKI